MITSDFDFINSSFRNKFVLW